ncbi:MAG: sulfite exporter TauE/SafE family protein [Gammaproteobacteria bacterium]
MLLTAFAAYLVCGAVAGLLAGLLGVGGGLVIVPVLTLLFSMLHFSSDVIVHLAVGTSLATIVFTSLSSVRAHHRRQAVDWFIVWRLVPGIIFGALLGAIIADAMPTKILRNIFIAFELLVAIQMFASLRPQAQRDLPGRWGMSVAGTTIGMLSSIVGIGGGTLTVPFLVWCRVAIHRAIGTASACGLPIALGGSLGFIVMGWGHPALPEASSGFVYWPAWLGIVLASVLAAPLGAALAHRLPATRLKKIFATFLMVLALMMLFIK